MCGSFLRVDKISINEDTLGHELSGHVCAHAYNYMLELNARA